MEPGGRTGEHLEMLGGEAGNYTPVGVLDENYLRVVLAMGPNSRVGSGSG